MHIAKEAPMDAAFTALTLALLALLVVGLAALELGMDSRPGFDGSTEH